MSSTTQTARIIEDIPTDVVIQRFADRILVLITQLGKVGTLIQATIPEATPLLPPPTPPDNATEIPLPPPPPSINLTPLLGNAPSEHLQTLHSLYAAQVATLIWTSQSHGALAENRQDVIVGVALRPTPGVGGEGSLTEIEQKVFRGVMATIRDLLEQK